MSRYFRRREPTLRERLAAAALAAGAAAVTGAMTFYVVRTLLAREPLEEPPRPRKSGQPPEAE